MDRGTLMVARAYLPTVLALVAAFVGSMLLGRPEQSPLLTGLAGGFRWVPMLAFGAALGLGAWATVRLCRAEHGLGLLCDCGGILGTERSGRYGPIGGAWHVARTSLNATTNRASYGVGDSGHSRVTLRTRPRLPKAKRPRPIASKMSPANKRAPYGHQISA